MHRIQIGCARNGDAARNKHAELAVPASLHSCQAVHHCWSRNVPSGISTHGERNINVCSAYSLHDSHTQQALLVYSNSEMRCGGSLISEQFVLTAGHCFADGRGRPTHVKLGVHNIVSSDAAHDPYGIQSRTFAIAENIRHPQYKQGKLNDIGLIRLERRVVFNPYMRPACLPGRHFQLDERTTLTATGWGVTNVDTMRTSNHLLKASLGMFSASVCENWTKLASFQRARTAWDAQTQICVGSRWDAQDSCFGDSGGPLQTEQQPEQEHCMYTVLGVVSIGIGCGVAERPAMYTRVQAFLPWIEDVVWSSTNMYGIDIRGYLPETPMTKYEQNDNIVFV